MEQTDYDADVAREWEQRFHSEGFPFHPRTPVRVDYDIIEQLRELHDYSIMYLCAASKEGYAAGRLPSKFSDSPLKNAKHGNRIHFGIAYSLALLLECPVGAIVPLVSEEEEPTPEDSPKGPTIWPPRRYVPRDIISDISIWLRTLVAWIFTVTVIYVIALLFGMFENMRPVFPVLNFLGALFSGYTARRFSAFPMPLNLRLQIGLFGCTLVGGVAFFGIVLFARDHLDEFLDIKTVQLAMIFFIISGILAYFIGYDLASSKRIRLLMGTGRPFKKAKLLTSSASILSLAITIFLSIYHI